MKPFSRPCWHSILKTWTIKVDKRLRACWRTVYTALLTVTAQTTRGDSSRHNKHCGAAYRSRCNNAHFILPHPWQTPISHTDVSHQRTHKPLHPEYVNQDKDPFKHRVSENCTLLLSFSSFLQYALQDCKLPSLFFFFFLPPRGHICLERQEQKHVSRMSVKGIRKLTRKGDNTRVVFGWGGEKKRMIE